MIYKKILMATMCLTAAFAFSSCAGDDELDVNRKADKIGVNQMFIEGTTLDATCDMVIRHYVGPWKNIPDQYSVNVTAHDSLYEWHGNFVLNEGLVGKSINLADPKLDIDKNYFSASLIKLYYIGKGERARLWKFSLYGSGGSWFEEESLDDTTCFTSGTFKSSYGEKGFQVSLSGVFVDGKAFSLKIVVPEEKIVRRDVEGFVENGPA